MCDENDVEPPTERDKEADLQTVRNIREWLACTHEERDRRREREYRDSLPKVWTMRKLPRPD